MSDLIIKVGDREYPFPDMDFDHWRKMLKRFEEAQEKDSDTSIMSTEGLDWTIDFYYELLHPYYPELTKKALNKMPTYQGGFPFFARISAKLTEIPLDSESPKPEENAESGEKE